MNDDPNSANRDALTGAANEAGLLRFLTAVLNMMDRQGPPVGFLRVAIDGFEDIASHLGEAAGDALLLGVADRLHEGVRTQDLVGRLGDGFGICMPDVLPAQARGAAERLRRAMAAAPLATSAGDLGITCSIGIALAHGSGLTVAALVAEAQGALRTAQRSGGDRIAASG
jgi:diguanylate cyclase (GGDEF)-like protein